jgi:hypothetical protein
MAFDTRCGDDDDNDDKTLSLPVASYSVPSFLFRKRTQCPASSYLRRRRRRHRRPVVHATSTRPRHPPIR